MRWLWQKQRSKRGYGYKLDFTFSYPTSKTHGIYVYSTNTYHNLIYMERNRIICFCWLFKSYLWNHQTTGSKRNHRWNLSISTIGFSNSVWVASTQLPLWNWMVLMVCSCEVETAASENVSGFLIYQLLSVSGEPEHVYHLSIVRIIQWHLGGGGGGGGKKIPSPKGKGEMRKFPFFFFFFGGVKKSFFPFWGGFMFL